MSDLPVNPAMPTEGDVVSTLQALADQYGDWHTLKGAPNIDTVTTLARQMYPGYDGFPASQQYWAWQIANASWLAQNNPAKAGANLTPGTVNEPNLALDATARQMYGSDAWMLNIPEVRVVLETAAQKQWDQQTLEAQVRSTKWWQTTTQAQEEFAQLQSTSPEELDFSNPGSQASQRFAHVQALDAQLLGPGMGAGGQSGTGGLDVPALQKIAVQSMEFSWSDDLIKQALANQVQYNPGANPNTAGNNAAPLITQLQSVNNDYLIGNDPAALQQWARSLASGTFTLDQYKAQAQALASQKYTWATPQLQQGQNMTQITSSLRSQAAQLMETDPNQVDFVNNPMYQKMLDYVAPGDTVHRAMTGSEAATYLRGTSQWGYTQQARDLAGTWASNLTKTFGKVAA